MNLVRTSRISVLFLILAASSGCRPSTTPASASAAPTLSPNTAVAAPGTTPGVASRTNVPNGGSPVDALDRLRWHHQRHAYEEVGELIVSEKRQSSIELLRALDDVLAANDALKSVAEARYSGPMTETWTLASMRNNIGPFSDRIRLIGQRFKGHSAIITLQAGDNIPLLHLQFELVDGRWLYSPEASPAKLTKELRELTRVLDDVRESVAAGASFESYLDSFFYRVLPRMIGVISAKDEMPGKVAAGAEAE